MTAAAKTPAKTGLALNPYAASVLVFVFFALIFLALRTRDYVAADGALRCLEVYHRQELFFHGNNHLLYPANICAWSHAAAWLGVKADTPFEFITLSQAMNAFAAAICLAVMYILVWLATSSLRIALAACAAYGFSQTFLLHATNSAEPVVGLLYADVGILIVVEGLYRGRNWLLVFAGASFAMALASYQSMVLIAVLAFLLCFGWPAAGIDRSWKVRLQRLICLSAGGSVLVCVIYGFAYWISGERTIGHMIHRFFQVTAGEVYGYFSLAKLVNLPSGLLRALIPALPPDYVGVRSLLRERHNLFWISIASIALIWLGGIVWSLARPVTANWRAKRPAQRLLLALLMTLPIMIGPLLFWDPLYDKLWLQPLEVVIFVVALLYQMASAHNRRGTTLAILCFLMLQAGLNLSAAVRAHYRPTEGLSESRIVADIVTPRDFVVLSFDNVSTLYLALWGSSANTLLLPASTPHFASQRISEAMKETADRGGSVYFLSVLDMSEQEWAIFLGNRLAIPYHSFDEYRARSIVVRTFESQHRMTLRKLE